MQNSYVLYTDKLEGEYKTTFRQIEIYVNANNIDGQSKEELLSNLLDTFLVAQDTKRPVEKIIGKNLEKFCKTICSGYGFKEQMIHFLEEIHILVYSVFIMSAVEVIIFFLDYLEGADVSFFAYQAEYNIMVLLFVHFLDIFTGFITKRMMFKWKKTGMTFTRVLNGLSIVMIILALLLLWSETNYVVLPVWICFVISGILALAYRIVTRENRRKKQENQISFLELIGEGLNENPHLTLGREKYFKQNRKRRKKGLAPLSQEEFLQAELKKCYRWDKKTSFYILFPFVLAIIATLGMYVGNQFATLTELGVFLTLMLLVEGLIIRWGWKTERRTISREIAWITQELENPTVWEEENSGLGQ